MIVRTIYKDVARIVVLILLAVAGMLGQAGVKAQGLLTRDPQTPGIRPIALPGGYRDWKLISVAHEAGDLNDLRAIFGNKEAYKSARKGALPFPDGAMIARLAWVYTPSEKNNKAFGKNQSFVAGAPTNIQLLVKDSRKFAATGGWGFAQFRKGNSANEARAKDCFGCHLSVKASDYVYAHYAP